MKYNYTMYDNIQYYYEIMLEFCSQVNFAWEKKIHEMAKVRIRIKFTLGIVSDINHSFHFTLKLLTELRMHVI